MNSTIFAISTSLSLTYLLSTFLQFLHFDPILVYSRHMDLHCLSNIPRTYCLQTLCIHCSSNLEYSVLLGWQLVPICIDQYLIWTFINTWFSVTYLFDQSERFKDLTCPLAPEMDMSIHLPISRLDHHHHGDWHRNRQMRKMSVHPELVLKYCWN